MCRDKDSCAAVQNKAEIISCEEWNKTSKRLQNWALEEEPEKRQIPVFGGCWEINPACVNVPY